MTSFEYVSVLLSIVVSMALAHLLIGVSQIIRLGVSRWSVPLLGWVGFLIFACIDYWFSVWHARSDPVWSLGFVCFLLGLGAVLFVNCRLVIPADGDTGPIDLAAYHASNRRRFLTGILLYVALGMIANQMLPGFQSLAVTLIGVGQVLALLAALIWDSPAAQLGAIAAMYLVTGWYAVNVIPAL
jgi:hypothetical protein